MTDDRIANDRVAVYERNDLVTEPSETVADYHDRATDDGVSPADSGEV